MTIEATSSDVKHSTPFSADEREILTQQVDNLGFGVCPHCRIAFEPEQLPDRLRCECQGCGRWYELEVRVRAYSS